MRVCPRSALAFLAATTLAGRAAGQCVLCREAVATGAGSGLLQGLRWSYAVLLLPALLFSGAFAFLLVRALHSKPRE